MIITPITSHFQGLSVACLLRWLSWTQNQLPQGWFFVVKTISSTGHPRIPSMHCLVWNCDQYCVRPSSGQCVTNCCPRRASIWSGIGTLGILNHALKWPCHQRLFEALSLNRLYALFKNAVGNTRLQKATNSEPDPSVWEATKTWLKMNQLWLNWVWCQMIHHSKYSKNYFQNGPKCLILKETCGYSELKTEDTHTTTLPLNGAMHLQEVLL